MKRSFRPGSSNRLDEIVFYKPLTRDNIFHIIDLLMNGLNRRLEDKRLRVELTEKAKEPHSGRRLRPHVRRPALRRYLQHTVENLVGRKIIAGDVAPDTTLTVDVRDGELTIL